MAEKTKTKFNYIDAYHSLWNVDDNSEFKSATHQYDGENVDEFSIDSFLNLCNTERRSELRHVSDQYKGNGSNVENDFSINTSPNVCNNECNSEFRAVSHQSYKSLELSCLSNEICNMQIDTFDYEMDLCLSRLTDDSNFAPDWTVNYNKVRNPNMSSNVPCPVILTNQRSCPDFASREKMKTNSGSDLTRTSSSSSLRQVLTDSRSEAKQTKVRKSSTKTDNEEQKPRQCTHCLVMKTPQWRRGPFGPKTLCNACGVRFKSGRLCPEYRPACSPSFSDEIHSNSHKKVLELRKNSCETQ